MTVTADVAVMMVVMTETKMQLLLCWNMCLEPIGGGFAKTSQYKI